MKNTKSLLKKLSRVAAIGLALLCASPLSAQEPSPKRQFNLDLPLLDMPFNAKTRGTVPSMSQSIAVSRTFYDLAHLGLESTFDLNPRASGWEGFKSRFAYAFSDFFLLHKLPGGQAWVHEEWHRAVMANRGVASYNDVYNLKLFSSLIAVSHESDSDLVALKRDHPADQVRLAAAGMEAEHALAQDLESDTFFNENPSYRVFLLWSLNTSPIGYLGACASDTADKETDKQNQADGGSIPKRDFIGFDCTGWIRDLNRPEESFAARGTHPSGVGINRYTKFSDLTATEKDYLRLNRNLSYLNLINPFMFLRNAFQGGGLFGENEARYNMNLRHDLTSFGTSLSANMFYASSFLKTRATLFAYHNHLNWYPGMEINVLDLPVPGSVDWLASVRAQLWQQPKNFSFHTKDAMEGGLLGVKLAYNRFTYTNPYISLTGKTRGWVSGEVEQEKNLSTIVGVTSRL